MTDDTPRTAPPRRPPFGAALRIRERAGVPGLPHRSGEDLTGSHVTAGQTVVPEDERHKPPPIPTG